MACAETRSVLEFRSGTDVSIVNKMLAFPALGEKRERVWNLMLTNEFHMSNDGKKEGLFNTAPGPRRLPLFTGRMFNQFENTSEHSGFWIDETEGRQVLLGKTPDTGQRLDYQSYRWLHRRIARSTDTRTLISTIAPPMVFTEVNSTTLKVIDSGIGAIEQCYWCAVANSFVLDWLLRQSVASTLNMFYLYQLPVPRLSSTDARCISIAISAKRRKHVLFRNRRCRRGCAIWNRCLAWSWSSGPSGWAASHTATVSIKSSVRLPCSARNPACQ